MAAARGALDGIIRLATGTAMAARGSARILAQGNIGKLADMSQEAQG